MGKYNIEDFVYNGKYHDYCWNYSYNPNATIENCLANCTTLAIAFSYIHHLPYPVSRIVSAKNWNKVLINGWKAVPYGSCEIKVGDIIQWVDNVHVATVIDIKEGEPYLGCSWYTGIHGTAMYEGQYDTRDGLNTLQEVSDFMSQNYPYRLYHEATLYEESQRVGGLPEYVLVAPVGVEPVAEDKTRDQIHVLTNEQNIRDNGNNIVGVAKEGYYNVFHVKRSNGYDWYEVADDRYIAGVSGRVVFIPAESDLRRENEELKETIRQINELIKKWV